jgi:hypothetical protein
MCDRPPLGVLPTCGVALPCDIIPPTPLTYNRSIIKLSINAGASATAAGIT